MLILICILAYFMRDCDVCTMQKVACSCTVGTLTACCLPGCVICICICILVEHQRLIMLLGSQSCVMAGTGIMSGVLLWVMWWWRHVVPFNARLADGFCVCIMVGKSVMQGIVIIGVSSITLCSSACTCSCIASVTLCLLTTGMVFNKLSIFFKICSLTSQCCSLSLFINQRLEVLMRS
jgi:hypothetical protein